MLQFSFHTYCVNQLFDCTNVRKYVSELSSARISFSTHIFCVEAQVSFNVSMLDVDLDALKVKYDAFSRSPVSPFDLHDFVVEVSTTSD